MDSGLAKLVLLFAMMMTLFCFSEFAEGTYRKPPFNGSIFGKRGAMQDYDTGKALSAMCEIASEACQAWFPSQDK